MNKSWRLSAEVKHMHIYLQTEYQLLLTAMLEKSSHQTLCRYSRQTCTLGCSAGRLICLEEMTKKLLILRLNQGMLCSLNRTHDTVLTTSHQLLPRKTLLLRDRDNILHFMGIQQGWPSVFHWTHFLALHFCCLCDKVCKMMQLERN